jgi:hypothetical protein
VVGEGVEEAPGHARGDDIGTGLPTTSSVHEVAQQVAPSSRMVYVDNDRCKSGCAHTSWVVRAA